MVAGARSSGGAVRVRRPVRNQMQFVTQELDAVLSVEHQARAVHN